MTDADLGGHLPGSECGALVELRIHPAAPASPIRTPQARPEGGLSPSLLRRAVRAVLVLEGLERRRLETQGAGELWQKLVADADAEIDREECLG